MLQDVLFQNISIQLIRPFKYLSSQISLPFHILQLEVYET